MHSFRLTGLGEVTPCSRRVRGTYVEVESPFFEMACPCSEGDLLSYLQLQLPLIAFGHFFRVIDAR